jgi:hypothetical protein
MDEAAPTQSTVLMPPSERVAQRLTDLFAPTYLTLISIIQGVALAFLAQRIEATGPHFDASDWLLTSATFLLYLVVWQEYVMQILAFVWVPTLLDAAVPFAFLAGELFLAYFVDHDPRAWLLTLGLLGVVGTLAHVLTLAQTRAFEDENRDVARAVSAPRMARAAVLGLSTAGCLALWAFYDVVSIPHLRLIVGMGALLAVGVFVASTIPYWNRVVAYARSKQ